MPIEDYLSYSQADITWIKRVLAAEGITSKDAFQRALQNRDKGAHWDSLKHIGKKRDKIIRELATKDDEAWERITGLPVHDETTPFGEHADEPQPTADQH
jgi:hypothetical protein